jgi:hypothetical protein
MKIRPCAIISRESCFHYLCIWVLIRYAILLGWCIKQSKDRVFFFLLCELLHFFLALCYIWLMWVLKAWSFSVRSILRPSESLGDSPQSWWWLFCASVNPGRVSSASTRVPRFAFCDVVQICKCVCVCVCNGSLLKALLGFWKDKVFNLCVSCVLCSLVLCAFFFPPSWLKVASIWTREFASCVCFVFATTKGSWRRGGGGLGVKSRGWDVRILVNWGLGFFCEQ